MATNVLDGDGNRHTVVKLPQPWKGSRPPRRRRPHDVWAERVARRLVDQLIPDWRYDGALDTWFYWDGVRWRSDESSIGLFQKARMVCRKLARDIGDPEIGRQVSSFETVARAAYLSNGDARVATGSDVWDADRWLFNTPGGIVDLRTGASMPHQRAKLMTRLAGATPGGACPDWLRFLDDLTGGDRAYQNYLQRLVGYSLTGSTEERVVPYFWGRGLGKSLFLRTMCLLHGDYSAVAPVECFSAQSSDRHPTGLAAFGGKRLVIASSIDEETAHRNERRLEALTAGDPVAARFMGGEFFHYRAQLKLMLNDGAFSPRMDGMDQMGERLHPLPFRHMTAGIDIHLTDKFETQLGGIMAWAVKGAVLWWQHGLPPPPSTSR